MPGSYSLRRFPAPIVRLGLLALALVAVTGVVAPRALATPEYVHGGISPAACEVCHTDNHTNWPVASEKCLTCHTSYDAPDLPVTCWTCHAPGRDMTAYRTETACTAACHLADGSTSLHTPHAGGGGACTSCHPVSPSVSDAGGDPHHVVPLPASPTVAGFSPAGGAPGTPVTVTGTGFTKAIAVDFGGVRVSAFRVLSDTELTTLVPVGAITGPVAVSNAGGTGRSTTMFIVPGPVASSVTLAASPATVRSSARVTLSGTVGPAALGTTAVAVTVQRKTSGRWATAAVRTVRSTAGGGYRWTWRPQKAGAYRARAALAATAEHLAARSPWASFRVR